VDVTDWLLDGDPAIRWQVMRDLTDAPAGLVAAERVRVASEGWGARLLALQQSHGQWPAGIPAWHGHHLQVCRLVSDLDDPDADLPGPDAEAGVVLW